MSLSVHLRASLVVTLSLGALSAGATSTVPGASGPGASNVFGERKARSPQPAPVAPTASAAVRSGSVADAGTPGSSAAAPRAATPGTPVSADAGAAAPSAPSAPARSVSPGTADAGIPALRALTVVVAGDIAGDWPEDEATARLAEGLSPDLVLTTGDNAYLRGTDAEFAQWYQPTWGRLKAKTRPVPGNHDHGTPQLAGYCRYFGEVAGCQEDGFAYQAFDVGSWRVLALDSGGGPPGGPLDPMKDGSPQRAWLTAELAKPQKKCTVAVWHHPRFSSGLHGDDVRSQAVWEELSRAGVDLILTGHEHHYERFAPLTPKGTRDEARGMVQFIVGTGGVPIRGQGKVHPQSVVRNFDTHGVLRLALEEDAFSWSFVPVAGKTFTDTGRRKCH